MVNATLYNYLKENSGRYPLPKLKSKILKSGYTEDQFNEALGLLGIDPSLANVNNVITEQQNQSFYQNQVSSPVDKQNNSLQPLNQSMKQEGLNNNFGTYGGGDIKNKVNSKSRDDEEYDPESVVVFKKIRTVGILSIIWGIIGIIGTLVFVSLYSVIVSSIPVDYALVLEQNGIGFFDFLIFSIIPILFFSLNIVAGIGLMKHRNGGRYLLIFLSVLNLFLIGPGTVLGTLFIFLIANKKVRNLMR